MIAAVRSGVLAFGRARSGLPWLSIGLVVVLQVAIGVGAGTGSASALLLTVAVAGVVIVARWPWLVLVAVLPANYAYWRVGGRGLDLSAADAILSVAVVAALPYVPWRSATLHRVQRIYACYGALLLIAVASVPTRIAVISYVQRAVMVLGAVLVGTAIASTGRIAAALRVLYLASAVVAIAAMNFSLTHEYEPAYPFGMHKNLVGSILSMTLILSFVLRRQSGLSPLASGAVQLVLAGGLLASQARGAALSVVVAIAVAVLRSPRLVRNPLVLGALIAASTVTWLAFQTVDDQLGSTGTASRFDSVNSRLLTYDAAITLWKRDPVLGVGIKYWRDPRYADETGFGEPHSIIFSALGETGIVGLAAIIGLLAAVGRVAWTRPGPLWAAAVLVLISRVAEAQFSIFWVANSGSFLWVVVGMAIGDELREPRR